MKQRTNLPALQMVGPRHGVYVAKFGSALPMIVYYTLEICQECLGHPLYGLLCEIGEEKFIPHINNVI